MRLGDPATVGGGRPRPRRRLAANDILVRAVGAMALGIVLFYFVRPIYWAVEDRLVEMSSSDAKITDAQVAAEARADPTGTAPVDAAVGSAVPGNDPIPEPGQLDNPGHTVGEAQSQVQVVQDAAQGQPEPKGEAEGEAKPEGQLEATPEGQPEEKPEGQTEEKPEGQPEKISEGQPEKKPEEPAEKTEAKVGDAEQPTIERPRPEVSPGSLAKGVRPIVHEGRPLLDSLKRPIWERPPPDAAVPGREEFALRREMIEFRARDNVVVVTFANFAFLDFVTNWVRHFTELGVQNILVGAMDQKILKALFYEGVPVFDLESGMPELDAGWGTPLFHKMGREKVTLVNIFLALGFELFITDTDTMFLRDPLPFMARFPQADVLMSSDETVRTVDDESLEKWDQAYASYNIGILHFRPTDPARRFAREWAEMLDADEKIWDQNGFNDLMRRKLGPAVPDLNNGVFFAYDGSLKAGILPVSVFCSGHTYFVQSLYKVVGLKPYSIHAIFQFAGTPGKRHRFRESGEFYDPPGYYDPPNGIITFGNVIPEELLRGGEHTLQTHFNLVNYQLKNLRQALAIATILNRTLVLPAMWCRFERMWFPHKGILDRTVTQQPFLCPFDHIIEVGRMLPDSTELKVEEFGPAVDFREYSFLDNPRVPEEVKRSKLRVGVCERGSPNCENGKEAEGVPDAPKAIQLATRSRENEIRAVLGSRKEFKLLEFSTMVDSFGGWDDEVAGKKFNQRIRHYTGIWCCIDAQPGHIWYDFFAADKPGWTPKPPTGWKDDHPSWDVTPEG